MRPNNNYNNRNNRDSQPQVKKQCYFCSNKLTTVDYKDATVLRRFMSPHAKIMNHKRTGTCPKHQRMISLALKRARHMALLPFVAA
jgi:small subunit ribosomal protein S18